MKAEGWRHVWAHWHYFRDGASLCHKFRVSIIGGGEPRKPWPSTVPLKELDRVCQACESARTLAAVDPHADSTGKLTTRDKESS